MALVKKKRIKANKKNGWGSGVKWSLHTVDGCVELTVTFAKKCTNVHQNLKIKWGCGLALLCADSRENNS